MIKIIGTHFEIEKLMEGFLIVANSNICMSDSCDYCPIDHCCNGQDVKSGFKIEYTD